MLQYSRYILLWWIVYCFMTYMILHYGALSDKSWNIIHSPMICDIASYINWFSSWIAKAVGAIPLFPIVRFVDHPMNSTWIRHEYIHHMQIAESLWIRMLISMGENIYYRFVRHTSPMEAYLLSSTEQEAYLNQNNPNYLHQRPLFATWRYLMHKTKFILVDYHVQLE